MKLKFIDEQKNERIMNISFLSFFKLWLINYLVFVLIFLIIEFLLGIFSGIGG